MKFVNLSHPILLPPGLAIKAWLHKSLLVTGNGSVGVVHLVVGVGYTLREIPGILGRSVYYLVEGSEMIKGTLPAGT
ncbi:MAG: hypothetical protein R6T87_02480 [Marinobacter sp.]